MKTQFGILPKSVCSLIIVMTIFCGFIAKSTAATIDITATPRSYLFSDSAVAQSILSNVNVTISDDIELGGGYLTIEVIEHSNSDNEFLTLYYNHISYNYEETAGGEVYDGDNQQVGTLVENLREPGNRVLILLNENADANDIEYLIEQVLWGVFDNSFDYTGSREIKVNLTDANNVEESASFTTEISVTPKNVLFTFDPIGDVLLDSTTRSQAGSVTLVEFDITPPKFQSDFPYLLFNELIFDIEGDLDLDNLEFILEGPWLSKEGESYYKIENEKLYLQNTLFYVSEGNTETFELKAWFKEDASIVDNESFTLTIDADQDINYVTENATYYVFPGFAATEAVISGNLISSVEATELDFIQIASSAVSGEVIQPAINIHATDQYGNLDTDFNEEVTVALSSSDPGTLSGTTTVNAVNGVATFSNLVITNAAVGIENASLVASATGISGTYTVQTAIASNTQISPVISFPNDADVPSVFGDSEVIQKITSVSIGDVDSPNFNNGSVTISFGDGVVLDEDYLTLFSEYIDGSENGASVIVDDIVIGHLAAAIAIPGESLEVALNENATTENIAELLSEALKYGNANYDNPTTGTRTIHYSLFDGNSTPASAQLEINVELKDRKVEFIPVSIVGSNEFPSTVITSFDTGKKLLEFQIGISSTKLPTLTMNKIEFQTFGTLDPNLLNFYIKAPFSPHGQRLSYSGRYENGKVVFDCCWFWANNYADFTYSVFASFKTKSTSALELNDGQTLQLAIDPNENIQILDLYTSDAYILSNEFPATETFYGDTFVAEIAASKLDFSDIPAQIVQNTSNELSVTVSAVDPAGRTDVDFVDQVTLYAEDQNGNPVTLLGNTTVTAANGVAVFSNLSLGSSFPDGSTIRFMANDTIAGEEGDLTELTSSNIRVVLAESTPTVSLSLSGSASNIAYMSNAEVDTITIVAEIKGEDGSPATLDSDVSIPLDFSGTAVLGEQYQLSNNALIISAGESIGSLELSSIQYSPVSIENHNLSISIVNGQLLKLREDTEQQVLVYFFDSMYPNIFSVDTITFSGKEDVSGNIDLSQLVLVNESYEESVFTIQVERGVITGGSPDSYDITYSLSEDMRKIEIGGRFDVIQAYLQDQQAIIFNPDENDNGQLPIEISLSEIGSAVTAAGKLEIEAVNDAPTISGSPVTSILEGEDYLFIPISTDVDSTDLVFSVSNLPYWAQLNSETGAISGLTDNNDAGIYSDIILTVSDGEYSATLPAFSIEVRDLNSPPVISLGESHFVSLNEDSQSVVSLSAIDEDGDRRDWSISSPAINGVAILSGTGRPSLIYTPDADYFGTDSVTVVVTDGKDSDSVIIDYNVVSVNDAPVISGSPIAEIQVSESYQFTALAEDIDSTNLTFYGQNIPGWLSLNTSTGLLSGVASEADIGRYLNIVIGVSDGVLNNTLPAFNIDVTRANAQPQLLGQQIEVDEDSAIVIDLNGTDSDGDELTYEIDSNPFNGSITLNNESITYTPNPDYFGEDNFTVTVSDGIATSEAANFSVSVLGINDTPVIRGQPTISIDEGKFYSFTPSAEDPDNDDIRFSVLNNPQWLVLNEITGELSGNVPQDAEGLYPGIQVTVYDDEFSQSLDGFDLTVIGVNVAPIIVSEALVLEEDQPAQLNLQINDVDGDSTTARVVNQGQLGNAHFAGATLHYQPYTDVFGSDSITVMANDGDLDSLPVTIDIEIRPVNDAPIANDDTFNFIKSSTGQYLLDVLVNDTDVDLLSGEDQLTLFSAATSFGSVYVAEDRLQLDVGSAFKGPLSLQYTLVDSAGEMSSANATVNVSAGPGDALVVITPPDDIEVNAQGQFTWVEPGKAVAHDTFGNKLDVHLNREDLLFSSGAHQIEWRARLDNGDLVSALQKINVWPVISIEDEVYVQEGHPVSIKVELNGLPPEYPVILNYSISGTADIDDHDLSEGELIIESGMVAFIDFNIAEDDVAEADETIVVTLRSDAQNIGNDESIVLITENEMLPKVALIATQKGVPKSIVEQNAENLVVSAKISSVISGDRESIQWFLNGTVLQDETSSVLELNPMEMEMGVNKIAVVVTSAVAPSVKNETETFINLVTSYPALSHADSDGDSIPDLMEGFLDSDSDGIADYLDSTNSCSLIQLTSHAQEYIFAETLTGECIVLGEHAIEDGADGIALNSELVTSATESQDFTAISSAVDFRVNEIARFGGTSEIVIPLDSEIATGAWYRQFNSTVGWHDFLLSANDQIYTANQVNGVCPSVRDSSWKPGVLSGYQCLKLAIQDGGSNDMDGLQNYAVASLGYIGLPKGSNMPPVANDDAYVIRQGVTTLFDLLANDIDPEGMPLQILEIASLHGEIGLIDATTVQYHSPNKFSGTDRLNYKIVDDMGASDSGFVTLTISENQAPVAISEQFEVRFNSESLFPVLDNDYDLDGDSISVVSASAKLGIAEVQQNGFGIRYTAPECCGGLDSIRYTIQDEFGGISIGYVTIRLIEDDGN
ncbi:Ig-like domain-containing protein [Planctobacterium marinum]|uniref:Ig-like domain-containing protein n=1 Tax=Planctobacterium marinum TaxID=1631968 RepID=UPI001E298344|nr:Ig-like domain-containing protein [Planctobacterium marinum]MCC2607361.1 Ig-like domain-containing protein [Planctobacterium marinum]